MLSRRSYVRLFTMVLLLTGTYVSGVRADAGVTCQENGALMCYSTPRDSPAQSQGCTTACSSCGYSSSTWNEGNNGGPENGASCQWIVFCLCEGPLET